MSMTDRNDRQLVDTSVSKYKKSKQSSSSNVNNVMFNSSAIQGVDHSNHSFDSETPTQPKIVHQNLFSGSSSYELS